MHAHCLVDGIGDDERFERLLQKAFHRNLAHEIRRVNSAHFYEQDAKVYLHKTDGSCSRYTEYMLRQEGYDFRFGVDKVVLAASYLNQSRSDKQ